MDLNNDNSLKDIGKRNVRMLIKKTQHAKKAKQVLLFNKEDYANQGHTHFDQSIINILENTSIENENLPAYILKLKDIKHLKTEAAKLKLRGGMNNIDPDNILNVFTIFEKYIKVGSTTAIEFNTQDKCSISNSDTERIFVAAEMALTSLFILTSPEIDPKLYFDDLLEEIITFTTYQLQKLIQPVFKETKKKNSLKSNNKTNKFFVILIPNISEIIVLLSELFTLKKFSDNFVLKASTLGLSGLFSRIQDIELSSLKLLTSLFSRYQKHGKYIIDDIFSFLIENGNVLHPYKLCSGEGIQLITALFMLFIQSVISVHIDSFQDDNMLETLVIKAWNSVKETTFMLLHQFIVRVTKSEGKIFRSFLDNFIQDLLLLLNYPEWPVAEIILRAFCITAPEYLNSSDLGLRSLATEIICNIAHSLTKYMRNKINYDILDSLIIEYSSNSDNKAVKKDLTKYEKIHLFQRILLDYLASQNKYNLVFSNARDFYIVQWYQTNFENTKVLTKLRMESKHELDKDKVQQFKKDNQIQQFLRTEILNRMKRVPSCENKQLTFERMNEVLKFLFSESKLYNYFNRILLCMVNTLKKNEAVAIRAKILKGLANIIDLDSKALNNSQIELTVEHLFFDTSALIRESAVDLIGKLIIRNRELISTYYDPLVSRILDVSVSVRKTVLKILMDICITYSDLPQIPEILLKIVCRMNDEDTIQNLVRDFFLSLWFNPVKETQGLDEDTLVKKVWQMISAISQTNISFYETLCSKIFKGDLNKSLKNNASSTENIKLSCHQIVNCLIQTIVQLEKLDSNSKRLSSCLIIIALLSKYHPEMLVPYAETLHNYLSIECKGDEDYKIISSVAEIFTHIIPLMKHPSLLLLCQLEEDFVKIIMQQKPSVIVSSVNCLSEIFKITKNFKLLRDCFSLYYKFIKETKQMIEQKKSFFQLSEIKTSLNRSIFVIGLLIYKFDFNDPVISDNSFSLNFKNDIIETVKYFLNYDLDTQLCVFKFLGFLCSRYTEQLLDNNIKSLYTNNLTKEITSDQIKIQILNNLEYFLLHEDNKFSKDNETVKIGKEKIKKLEDIHLGMGSTIIQQYLDSIVECLFNTNSNVRNEALKVIQLILLQGLIDPLQLMPYLIAVCTDENIKNLNMAEKLILEVEEKFPGYTYLSAYKGLQLSFKFQKRITNGSVIRGWRLSKGHTKPNALNSFLYTQLKTRKQVRSFLLSLIKQLDENSKISTGEMLYIADNLAYFPYKYLEEVMYILYQIDTILSISGSNMLQMFHENLLPIENDTKELSESTDDENEIELSILKRFPEDVIPLSQCIQLSRGCQLLGMVKQHLAAMYKINLWKMKDYSPSSIKKGLVSKPAIIKVKTNYFIPQNIIKHLSTEVSKLSHSTLVKEYLNFKKLINALDIDNLQQKKSCESLKDNSLGSLSEEHEVTQTPETTGGKSLEKGVQENDNNKVLSNTNSLKCNAQKSSLLISSGVEPESHENIPIKSTIDKTPKRPRNEISSNSSTKCFKSKNILVPPLEVLAHSQEVISNSSDDCTLKGIQNERLSEESSLKNVQKSGTNVLSPGELAQQKEGSSQKSTKERIQEKPQKKKLSDESSLKYSEQRSSGVESTEKSVQLKEFSFKKSPKERIYGKSQNKRRIFSLSTGKILNLEKSGTCVLSPRKLAQPQEVSSQNTEESVQLEENTFTKSQEGKIQGKSQNKRLSQESIQEYFDQSSSAVPTSGESPQAEKPSTKKILEENNHGKARKERSSDHHISEQPRNILSPRESAQPKKTHSKRLSELRRNRVLFTEDKSREHQNKKSHRDALSPLRNSEKKQLSEDEDELRPLPNIKYHAELAVSKQPKEILQGSLENQILSKLKRKRASNGNVSPLKKKPMRKVSRK